MPENTERLSTALADRYKIERHLGEGGMATVYLAEDLKHHRKVAVKVLRPELAAVLGAERFVQEIETTANLQHPHILPLHDSGDADGFLYYVMPFIDGETLRDKLNRETQLGIEEAVRITTDIADALDYAHRHNVIHRDIKPENILLHDGRPMVADFGIALAVSAAAGGRMTETGLSLGTPHYMSPEQATAEKDLTHRSDIYSLGSVLYEMLAGDPPHTASSAQQIIMKIVTDKPRPLTALRKSVPPHVAAATAKSLEKLAADRFGTAKEFAEALTNPAFTLPSRGPVLDTSPAGQWNRLSIGVTAVATILLVTTLWGWLRPMAVPSRATATFAIPAQIPDDLMPYGALVAVAPDGRAVVYASASDAGRGLFARRTGELVPSLIAETEGGHTPFFSPDGQWVGFTADGKLQRVLLDGGTPVTITSFVNGGTLGASWGSDDKIVFSNFNAPGLLRVTSTDGTIDTLTHPNTAIGEIRHSWPYLTPDGKSPDLNTRWQLSCMVG